MVSDEDEGRTQVEPSEATLIRGPEGEVIADRVEHADGILSKAIGLMFRRSVPDGYALVFDLGRQKTVNLHMVFVPFDIEAVFLDGDRTVRRVAELPAWKGRASCRARWVIEIPSGGASEVDEGDRLRFE